MNMADHVAPKSDQLNSDDLISGPRTICITRVVGTGSPDQPVAVFFEGDDGKPLKPCKSMRRVMIAAWGADASQYAGRSMTLYRDPKVKFGGMEVGGIRISHMSHIEREMVMALTVTKAKREPYKVKVLQAPKPAPAPEPAQDWGADEQRAILNSKLELKDVPADVFPQRVRQALAGIHDLDTLAGWEMGMKPIVTDPDDWERIVSLIRTKRATLATEQPA